jgi:hypothetical protein
VWVGLVADVPDEPVVRRVEHVVERHGELDHPKPGAEVAAGYCHRVDRFLPQFVSKLAQLAGIELPEVGRSFDAVEQRGSGGHANAPFYLWPNGVYWGLVRAHPPAHAKLLVFTPF